jgi:hypothetical protein
VQGGRIGTFTIDADCVDTTVANLQCTSVADSSESTSYEGVVAYTPNSLSFSYGGKGPIDFDNLIRNGNLERWGAGPTAAPDGFSFIGNSIGWTKCGEGLSDTTAHLGRFSAKLAIVTSDFDAGAYALPLARVKGQWISVSVWVYSATDSPNPSIQMYVDGNPIGVGFATLEHDVWKRLHGVWFVASDATSAKIAFLGSALGSYYIADVEAHVGHASGSRSFSPPSNSQTDFYIGGAKMSSGEGSPESAVTGSPGDSYFNRSGGTGTTFYVKESGTNTNTGWVAK